MEMKKGDRVLLSRPGAEDCCRTVSTIYDSGGKKEVYIRGVGYFDLQSGWGRGRCQGMQVFPADSEEYASFQAQEDAKEKAWEGYQDRADVKIVSRLEGVQSETWLGLGLEKLETIRKWLDESTKKGD